MIDPIFVGDEYWIAYCAIHNTDKDDDFDCISSPMVSFGVKLVRCTEFATYERLQEDDSIKTVREYTIGTQTFDESVDPRILGVFPTKEEAMKHCCKLIWQSFSEELMRLKELAKRDPRAEESWQYLDDFYEIMKLKADWQWKEETK